MSKEKKNDRSGEIKWVKKGGGTAYLEIDGEVKQINKGQVFKALPSEIPEGQRDLFDEAPSHAAVKEAKAEAKAKTPAAPEPDKDPEPKGDQPEFDIVPDGTPGWYNIINKASGKQMNEKKLRPEEAQAKLKELVEG